MWEKWMQRVHKHPPTTVTCTQQPPFSTNKLCIFSFFFSQTVMFHLRCCNPVLGVVRWGVGGSGYTTLWASLSGTFLQTLPELVTPLKGHSLSPRSCPPTRSAPSERFGYWYDCRSNLGPKHTCKHETHPPWVKKKSSVSMQMIAVLFVLVWTLLAAINDMPCLTKHGSGWRKDVVNQCLEFGVILCSVSIGISSHRKLQLLPCQSIADLCL